MIKNPFYDCFLSFLRSNLHIYLIFIDYYFYLFSYRSQLRDLVHRTKSQNTEHVKLQTGVVVTASDFQFPRFHRAIQAVLPAILLTRNVFPVSEIYFRSSLGP
jgi:hypothetical protein